MAAASASSSSGEEGADSEWRAPYAFGDKEVRLLRSLTESANNAGMALGLQVGSDARAQGRAWRGVCACNVFIHAFIRVFIHACGRA